jgi:predicted dehydrogenase
MKTKLKAALIGAGHIGRFHTRHLVHHDLWDFVGFYDIDSKRSDEIANEFSVVAFDNAQAAIDASDAVWITTPTPSHFSCAKMALENGKHVFIEKPITETQSQALELVALAKKLNLKIQVGHIERFNPALQVLNTMDLKPQFIESHRLAPFNARGSLLPVIHENMIHDIDILLSLVNSPVKHVDATGVAVVTQQPDMANARITFENGCVANITASRISLNQMRKMRIFQAETYITIDFMKKSTELYNLVDGSSQIIDNARYIDIIGSEKKIRYQNIELPDVDAMLAEQTSFAESIMNNTTPVVSGEDGAEALRVAELILSKIK